MTMPLQAELNKLRESANGTLVRLLTRRVKNRKGVDQLDLPQMFRSIRSGSMAQRMGALKRELSFYDKVMRGSVRPAIVELVYWILMRFRLARQYRERGWFRRR